MPFKLGLSQALSHLEPDLPVVTKETTESFQCSLFLTQEDANWIGRRHRLLRPMFLTNETEARCAIEYYRQLSGVPPFVLRRDVSETAAGQVSAHP